MSSIQLLLIYSLSILVSVTVLLSAFCFPLYLASDCIMKWYTSHIAVASWMILLSHAILHPDKRPMTNTGSTESNFWAFILSFTLQTHFKTCFATCSSHTWDLSAKTVRVLVQSSLVSVIYEAKYLQVLIAFPVVFLAMRAFQRFPWKEAPINFCIFWVLMWIISRFVFARFLVWSTYSWGDKYHPCISHFPWNLRLFLRIIIVSLPKFFTEVTILLGASVFRVQVSVQPKAHFSPVAQSYVEDSTRRFPMWNFTICSTGLIRSFLCIIRCANASIKRSDPAGLSTIRTRSCPIILFRKHQ